MKQRRDGPDRPNSGCFPNGFARRGPRAQVTHRCKIRLRSSTGFKLRVVREHEAVDVTPSRSRFVRVSSSPRSRRVRISLSVLRTHASQAAAVGWPPGLSCAGRVLRYVFRIGWASENGTYCALCASAVQQHTLQTKNQPAVLLYFLYSMRSMDYSGMPRCSS